MFIDDHLVSPITSPRHVILVPHVQRVTFKLHFLACAKFVVYNAAHTCTLYVWTQDRHASSTSKSCVINIYLLTSWPHLLEMLTFRWRIAGPLLCVVVAPVSRVDIHHGGVVRAPGSAVLVAAGVVIAASPHLT